MKRINNINNKRFGFTLVEMLVVISIIGILSAVLAGGYVNSQKSARDAARKLSLKSISDALNQYYADYGVFPPSIPLGGEFHDNKGIIYMKRMPPVTETGGMTPIRYDVSTTTWKHFRLYTNLENDEDKSCIPLSVCRSIPLSYNIPSGCCYVVTSSNLGTTEVLP